MQRVLIADDNSNIQKMASLALKDAGIEVIAVNNGEAAVRKMPEILPDLVLADIFMPVRSGYEVCEFVKRDPRFMHTPVILLAGAFDPFDEREAQRVQADGVLKKPFVPPDPLVNMVTALLNKAAGERLVPVGVSASHSAQVENARQAAPAREVAPVREAAPVHEAPPIQEAAAELFTDDPPEEFKLPPDGPAFADDKTLAFGSLLEAPPSPVEADSVLTAMRDPVLGDPAFWAPAEVHEPPSADELTEGHSWEEPLAAGAEESAEVNHGQPADLDLPLEFPAIEYSARVLDEPAPETLAPTGHASPVLEWPVAEEVEADEVKTEEPPVAEANEAEPLPDWAALQADESETAPEHEISLSSYAAEEVEEVVSAPETEELAAAPLAEELAAPQVEAPAMEAFAASFAEAAAEIEPVDDVPLHASATEELPSVARLAESAQAEVMSSPDLASIFALAKTDLMPAIESEIKPYAASSSTPVVPKGSAPESATSPLDLEPSKAEEPPSPELIEAVVARVIARMQPKMIEIVTREILRPVVEALVRREIEKT